VIVLEYFGVLGQTQSEKVTAHSTRKYSKAINEELPLIIDVLFKITHFTEQLDTSKINFKSYCNDHYVQAPYTFNCLYNIFISGYYNEVMIILRHLYEVLAKLKYFYKYEDKLEPYLNGAWISESKFLKLDSDDSFLKTDYDILSRFAHGRDLFTVFRTKKPKFKKFIAGNYFDKETVNFILMQIIALLYGYLNCYVLFFPNNKMDTDSNFSDIYSKTIAGLNDMMEWHKKNNPQSVECYSNIKKYISRY